MLTIWKYPLDLLSDNIELEIPSPAKSISFQIQYGKPTLWCLVNPDMDTVKKKFRMAGTGYTIDDKLEDLKHIGTVQILNGNLIYHLFEVVS